MADMSALVTAAVEQAKAAIEENNKVAAQIKAAGNIGSLIADIRDTAETEDVTVLEYRAFMDKANAAILDAQAKVEKYIREAGLLPTETLDVEAATAAWKAQNDIVKAVKSVLKSLPGGEDALNSLPEVVGIPGTRGGNSGGGTGIRRPRFQSIAYTVAGSEDWKDVQKTTEKDGETVSVTNLSLLAQVLNSENKDASNVGASDLQGALFSEAKTEDLSTLNGEPVTFAFSVGEKNYLVRVTPRVAE